MIGVSGDTVRDVLYVPKDSNGAMLLTAQSTSNPVPHVAPMPLCEATNHPYSFVTPTTLCHWIILQGAGS
jgi:hypothetical protein